MRRTLLATSFAMCIATLAQGQNVVLFTDDFEGGTSAANYTTVADTTRPAGTTGNPASDIFDAAYVYTDLGDSSDVRSGTGARFITEDALTAFVNGIVVDGSAPISIKYDLYANPSSSGSTEYAFVGVGSGNLPFQHYLRGSLVGTEETDGVFAGGLTDSDTAGDGDYVILEGDGSLDTSPVDLYNADAAGNAQLGASFADILPALTPGPSGETTPARVLQHRWVEVELIISGKTALYMLDGEPVAGVPASGDITGLIGFGIGDPFTSSNQGMRIPPTADTDIIIDNIVITQLPEPTSALLAAGGLLVAGLRRRG